MSSGDAARAHVVKDVILRRILTTVARLPYYGVTMETRTICDQHQYEYQDWYYFYFTPPALLVGRSVLIR